MSDQDFFDLLQRLVGTGAVDKMGISEDKAQRAQKLLENVTSGDDMPDQGEISKVIRDMTSNLSEEKKGTEFLEDHQAAQQLESEQLTDDLLKILYLFLDRT